MAPSSPTSRCSTPGGISHAFPDWIVLGGGLLCAACEGRAPGVLGRAGWSRNILKAGETVTVDMSPAKDGSKTSIIARVTKADGTILSNQPVFDPRGN